MPLLFMKCTTSAKQIWWENWRWHHHWWMAVPESLTTESYNTFTVDFINPECPMSLTEEWEQEMTWMRENASSEGKLKLRQRQQRQLYQRHLKEKEGGQRQRWEESMTWTDIPDYDSKEMLGLKNQRQQKQGPKEHHALQNLVARMSWPTRLSLLREGDHLNDWLPRNGSKRRRKKTSMGQLWHNMKKSDQLSTERKQEACGGPWLKKWQECHDLPIFCSNPFLWHIGIALPKKTSRLIFN